MCLMVLGTVFVVTQVEVILQGVTKHQNETSQVQQWLTSGVVTVKELGFVTTNQTRRLDGWGWALWQGLVELNDRGQSLSSWVGTDVLSDIVSMRLFV
jgi:hypothetical protein